MLLWVAGFVLIALLAYVIAAFNELIAERNRVRTAWADIDVQLQRRHDLVPQLIAIVRSYADYEKSTLTAVTELRTRAQDAGSVALRGQIETELAGQMTRLLGLGERYPDLKASANFAQLQRDLVDTEDRLQSARSVYNEAVRNFNTDAQNFPNVLFARAFGFQPAAFFQAEPTADSAPQIAETQRST